MAKTSKTKQTALAPVTKATLANIVYPERETQAKMPAIPEFKGKAVKRAPSTLTPIVEFSAPGDYVIGVFKGIRDEVGPNKSHLYDLIQEPTGEYVSMWGSTILDAKFNLADVPIGARLCVIYLGTVPTSRGLNPAKMFELLWEEAPAK